MVFVFGVTQGQSYYVLRKIWISVMKLDVLVGVGPRKKKSTQILILILDLGTFQMPTVVFDFCLSWSISGRWQRYSL